MATLSHLYILRLLRIASYFAWMCQYMQFYLTDYVMSYDIHVNETRKFTEFGLNANSKLFSSPLSQNRLFFFNTLLHSPHCIPSLPDFARKQNYHCYKKVVKLEFTLHSNSAGCTQWFLPTLRHWLSLRVKSANRHKCDSSLQPVQRW